MNRREVAQYLYERAAEYRAEANKLAHEAAQLDRMAIHADDPYAQQARAADLRAQAEWARTIGAALTHEARHLSARRKGASNAS